METDILFSCQLKLRFFVSSVDFLVCVTGIIVKTATFCEQFHCKDVQSMRTEKFETLTTGNIYEFEV